MEIVENNFLVSYLQQRKKRRLVIFGGEKLDDDKIGTMYCRSYEHNINLRIRTIFIRPDTAGKELLMTRSCR